MDAGDSTGIQIVTLVVLLCLSAFFSSAETALITVNKIRIRSLADGGNRRAIILTKVIEDPSKMLGTILIGNNIVNLSASALATSVTLELFGSKMVSVATGILTLLILVFGEITPKTLATIYSEKIALAYATVIYYLMMILTPVIFIVNKLSLAFLFLLRIDPKKKQDAMTEDELRTIVEVSHEDGVIETEEKKMINNVFDFGDTLARDIMVPRVDMVMADIESTYEELIDMFREEKFTRLPIYEESTDNVIGTINMKDLLLIESTETFSVKDVLREAFYTYEFKNTAELMVEMRKTFNSIVVVLDEYGMTAGLITLEDMLEEIVGEIRDEYDEGEEDEILEVVPGEYVVEGSNKLDDINEALELSLESDVYDSIGGLIIGLLGHLPEQGEEVDYENLHFVVDQVEKNRIEKVHIYVSPIEESLEEEQDKE